MNGSDGQGFSLSAPRTRAVLLIALVAFAGLVVGLLRVASDADAAPPSKVVICHVTGSATNPYVIIEVSEKAYDGEGKNDHRSHGDRPPENGACTSSPSGGDGGPTRDTTTGGNQNQAPATATVTETAASVQGAAPNRAAARTCISRRAFRIRVRSKRRDPVVKATVSVNGRRVASRRGKRVTAPVVLRGLAKGTYVVKITATTRRGRKLSGTRRYKTCVPKSRRRTIPLL